MTDIKFDILPQRSALMVDHSTELHALVRIQGPQMPANRGTDRKALNLSLVLDRSGSMNGQPMEEAKRCAAYIIDNLTERDRVSLVVYDSEVSVIVPSTPVVDKALFKRAINEIYTRGMTALFDGWEAGARQGLVANDGDYLSRVLLLSDGCANQGLTDTTEIARHCAEMASAGVSTSTYGLSHNFNEDLMVEMAKAGGGQSYYGESAEDLMDPFQEEFSLLSSLCARNLKLSLSAPAGVQFELLNDYKQLDDGSWQLPDVSFEGELWALVKITVPADLPAPTNGDDVEILKGFLSFTDIDTDKADTRSYSLRLPQVPAEAWAAIVEDTNVTARMQEVRVAQIQQQLRTAAMQRDWRTVDELIQQAELEAGDNAWLKASLDSIKRYAKSRDSSRMSKEARYSSQKMMNRMASVDEYSKDYTLDQESQKARHLRRKGEQGKRMNRPD
ncbi:MAG: VWA domain-containing protein [Halioglobus sp.]